MPHPYRGSTASLATKHGKGELLAPIFARLGVELEVAEVDTDQLGTFSPEIPRTLSQRETVLKKARLGMAQSGRKFGVASEASIGADTQIPFINSALESIAWIDEERGLELIEFHRSLDVITIREELELNQDLQPILTRADFPNHALIVYAQNGPIIKGIQSLEVLTAAIDTAFRARTGTVIIESDLRAHMSPSRQQAIRECGEKLVARLENLCGECGAPGFGEVGGLFGLPCEFCGAEVARAVRGVINGCLVCNYRDEEPNGLRVAPAERCGYCNP